MLTNVPWLFSFGMYFSVMLAVGISGTTQLFYFQYNLNAVNMYSIVSMISMLAGLPVYLILKPMVARFGNARCAVIGSAIAAFGYCVRFLLHDANHFILIGGYALGAFGQLLASSVIMLIIFDCAVYGEWKTGVANEAILVSGYSVSYKVGQALATPIAGFLLGAVPYVAGAASQEDSVLNLFFYENALLPMIGFLLSLLFSALLIKNEKQVPQMRKEIEERKKAAAAQQ